MNFLYLFTVENYPEGIADPESILLIREESDEDAGDINIDNLSFASTLAVKSDSPDTIVKDFKSWWAENASDIPSISLLAAEPSLIQQFRLEEIESLDFNSWSVKTNFVAYASDSEDAKKSAIELIKESELNVQ